MTKSKKYLPAGRQSWSSEVTKSSFALDLEEGVFTWGDPKKIAKSLKHSAKAYSYMIAQKHPDNKYFSV